MLWYHVDTMLILHMPSKLIITSIDLILFIFNFIIKQLYRRRKLDLLLIWSFAWTEVIRIASKLMKFNEYIWWIDETKVVCLKGQANFIFWRTDLTFGAKNSIFRNLNFCLLKPTWRTCLIFIVKYIWRAKTLIIKTDHSYKFHHWVS